MFYKATRPDGTDFRTGTIDYAAALVSGDVIRHPGKKVRNEPSTYLSVSVSPSDCIGSSWPCRLFRVEPVGRVMSNLDASPSKRAVSALRVVEELPAHLALGPNGEAVATFIERCRTMTREQAEGLRAARDAAGDAARDAAWYAARDAARDAAWYAARYAARYAAWYAARDAAWYAARYAAWYAARYAAWYAARDAAGDAAWDAAWYAARDAAGDAAWAIVVRDKLSAEHFATLTRPFADAGLGEWVA